MPRKKANRGGKRGGRTAKSTAEPKASGVGNDSLVDLTSETEAQEVSSDLNPTKEDDDSCIVIKEKGTSDNQKETFSCDLQKSSNENQSSIIISEGTEERNIRSESNVTEFSDTETSEQVSDTNSSQTVPGEETAQHVSGVEKRATEIDPSSNARFENMAPQAEQLKDQSLVSEGKSEVKEGHDGLTEALLQTTSPITENENEVSPAVLQNVLDTTEDATKQNDDENANQNTSQRENNRADKDMEGSSLQSESDLLLEKDISEENLENISLQEGIKQEKGTADRGLENIGVHDYSQNDKNIVDDGLENVSLQEDVQVEKNVVDDGLENVSLQEDVQVEKNTVDEGLENVSLQDDLQEDRNIADEGLENVSLAEDPQEEKNLADEGLENVSIQDDLQEEGVADEGLENVSLQDDLQEGKDVADEGLENVSLQDDLQEGKNVADEGLENVSIQDDLQEEGVADEGLENVSLQDDLQDENVLADEGLENVSLQEDLQEEENVEDEGLENVSLVEDLQGEKSMADEGLENVSLHEDVVEAELGKGNVSEEQEEVQYVDEDAEEEEQQLLDVMTDVAMAKSPEKATGQEKSDEHGNNSNNTNSKFEEISEGSIDQTEQEDVLNDTFSDVEIIEESFPMADKKGETEVKKNSARGAETLEEVFFATENDDFKVTAEDKDNDDISDASFDDHGNMSLEEISDDDVDVSKRRKKSTEAFKSKEDVKEEKPSETMSNADKNESENMAVLHSPKEAEKNEDEMEKTPTESKKRSPSVDAEKDDGNQRKKPRLSTEKDDEKENGAAFYTNICGIKKVAKVDTEKKSVHNQTPVKEPQRKLSGSAGKGALKSNHCQTDACVMRGKIVQCNIRPIKVELDAAVENSPFQIRKSSSKFLEQFGHKIPPSLPRPVIATITSPLSSKENCYHLALGPVTFGDMDLTELRNNFLKLSDKSSIDFDENHHGVYKALFKKQENVASFIRHLKALHLGNRYLTLNLVYVFKGSETSQTQLNGTINLMFEQDIQSEKQHPAQGDGKLRAKLLLSNMPYKVSKDFVHLLFPDALSVSSGSQFDGERSVVLGFTSTMIAKEITMRYDLVVINGKQVNVSALDYVAEEPENPNLPHDSEPVVIVDSESELQDGSQTTCGDNLVECFDEMDQEEDNNTEMDEAQKSAEVMDEDKSSENLKERKITSVEDDTSQQTSELHNGSSATELEPEKDENMAEAMIAEEAELEGTPTLTLSDAEQEDASACDTNLSEKRGDPAEEPILISDDVEVSNDAKDVQMGEVETDPTEIVKPAKVVLEGSSDVGEAQDESEESSDVHKAGGENEESSGVHKADEETEESSGIHKAEESSGIHKAEEESFGVNNDAEESTGVKNGAEESPGVKNGAQESSGVDKGGEGTEIVVKIDEILDSCASNPISQAEELDEVIEVSCEETHKEEPAISGDSESRQVEAGKEIRSMTEAVPVFRKSIEDISDEEIKGKENETHNEDTPAIEALKASKSLEDVSDEETRAKEPGSGDKESTMVEPSTSKGFEDVSDEEIQQKHKGGTGEVDDVVVLREDSSLTVLANIDLTVDTDSDADAGEGRDKSVNKAEASNVAVKDEKNLVEKSSKEVDERLVITDAGFEIDMEVIDVEEGDDKTVEKVLYPSKSLRHSRERSNSPSRSRKRSREQSLSSFSRDKPQRYHQRGLSPPARAPGGWNDYSTYRGERARGATTFREEPTRRRDNFQPPHRRSRSPVSPSRDARYYRDSHPPRPVVCPPPMDRGFYPTDRPFYPHKPSYPEPAHQQSSTYSRFPVSSHPPSQSHGPYGASSSRERVYQVPQREDCRPVYEMSNVQRDGQSVRQWESQTPQTQQEHRRTPSPPQRRKYRSPSRSLSDLSVDSSQGHPPVKKANRGNVRRDVAPRKESRSPVSVSSKSRSLSPVSRSPTPDRLIRDEIVKSVKQFLHAAKDLQNVKESRGRSVSQHSSRLQLSKQSPVPKTQHSSAATSSRRSPVRTGSRRSPVHTSRRSPVHTSRRSPVHTSRRSPVPVSSRRSPLPSSSRRSPFPSSSRRSPVPSSSRRSPVPASSRRSQGLLSSRRSPIPSKSRRSPAHTYARQSPGQMASNTQRRVVTLPYSKDNSGQARRHAAPSTYRRSRSRRSQSPETQAYPNRSPSPVSSDSSRGSPYPPASRRREYSYEQSAQYKYSQTSTSQSKHDRGTSSNVTGSREDTRHSSTAHHSQRESQYSHRQDQQREYPAPQETHSRHMISQQPYAPPPMAAAPPNPPPYGYPPAAPVPYGAQYPNYHYQQQMAPGYAYQSQPYGGVQSQPQYPAQSHYPPTDGSNPHMQQAYHQALGFLQTAMGGPGMQHTAQAQAAYPRSSQVQGQAVPVPNPSAKTKSWSMGNSSSMVFQRILGNEGKKK